MFIIVYLLVSFYRILLSFWRVYVRPSTRLKSYITPNSWCLITGATDGIGRQFALQLAHLNSNLILIGRNDEKLGKVREEIENIWKTRDAGRRASSPKEGKHANHQEEPKTNPSSRKLPSKHGRARQVRCIKIDLATCIQEQEVQDRIMHLFNELPISIVINNAGVLNDLPAPFHLLPTADINSMLAVNDAATLLVTKAILPQMIQRQCGLVVNVGSMAASLITPYMQVYGASKGFIEKFTLALNLEYAADGVHVEYLCPYYVVTKLSKVARESILAPSAEFFVRCAVATIGLGSFNIPVPMHRVVYEVTRLIPEMLLGKIVMLERKFVLRRLLKENKKGQ